MNDLLAQIAEYFSYSFVQRAFAVGVLVSLCASLLGVSLVLKRYSMIGDGLSHVGFATLAIAAVLNLSNSLIISVPVVILAAFLLLRLNENTKVKGDAAIALFSSSAIAIGYVVSYRLSNGSSSDVCNYMFGSLLTISKSEVLPCLALSSVVIILFVVMYNRIFSVTFDEDFARATGIRARLYNVVLALLTAITIVMGMKIMGTLLVSALIIFPALTSMMVCKSFKGVIICSAFISVICCVVGIISGLMLGTPAGSTVVLINLLAFLLFASYSFIKRKFLK